MLQNTIFVLYPPSDTLPSILFLFNDGRKAVDYGELRTVVLTRIVLRISKGEDITS